jgi:hypothetical protein
MAASVHALFVRLPRLLGSAAIAVQGRRSEFAKDVELLALRHQLVVLSRQDGGRRCGQPIVLCLRRSLECFRRAVATDWS